MYCWILYLILLLRDWKVEVYVIYEVNFISFDNVELINKLNDMILMCYYYVFRYWGGCVEVRFL